MNLQELRDKIDEADESYYNSGKSTADDSVYDGWKKQLREQAPDDERLTRVGASVPNHLGRKVAHRHPMGSLDNVMNQEEFLAFHERMKAQWHGDDEPLYNVSFKMDGGSVSLYYDRGELVCAATRGDGVQGEDITPNARKFEGVLLWAGLPPLKKVLPLTDRQVAAAEQTGIQPSPTMVYLPGEARPFTGSVRGEVVLHNEDWKILDPDMLSNPRNLGNGMTRRSSGEHAERLRFYAFRLSNPDGSPCDLTYERERLAVETESGMLNTLSNMGFTTVPCRRNCTWRNVLAIYQRVQGLPIYPPADGAGVVSIQQRDNIPFEIDGLVIKVESLLFQEKLGESSNRPRAMTAFKFPPLGARTKVLSVDWSVGHTGALVPTANLAPVKIGGVTVSRALLCNMEEIKRLGVHVGAEVTVVRRGDVIPKVVDVRVSVPGGNILPPTQCPVCEGQVGSRKSSKGHDSVMLYCLNPDCSAQELGKIKTWVKKLDIQGLGDVYLEKMFNHRINGDGPRFLTSVSILYLLHKPEWFRELVACIGEARAFPVVDQIERKRELSLENFLGCLGIDGLGRRRVAIVREKDPGQFDTLDDWLGNKLVERAVEAGLPGTASAIHQRIVDNIPLITSLIGNGVVVFDEIRSEPKKETNVNQFTFLITGSLSQPKQVFYDKIEAAGHNYVPDFKKGVTHLVTATKASQSSKMKKAVKEGCIIWDEQDLQDFLK